MTAWVLIFICSTGAGGCTYSNGIGVGSEIIGDRNESVVSFPNHDACQEEADAFNAIHVADLGTREVCRQVVAH